MKHLVHWPYVFNGDNFKMSMYEDINVYQWVQELSRCILEKTDPQTRTSILQYQGNLLNHAMRLY